MNIALSLVAGASAETAVRQAGFAAITARKKAYQIVRRPGVREALVEINQGIPTTPGMAKFNAAIEDPATGLTDVIALVYYRAVAMARIEAARRSAGPQMSEATLKDLEARVERLSKQSP